MSSFILSWFHQDSTIAGAVIDAHARKTLLASDLRTRFGVRSVLDNCRMSDLETYY